MERDARPNHLGAALPPAPASSEGNPTHDNRSRHSLRHLLKSVVETAADASSPSRTGETMHKKLPYLLPLLGLALFAYIVHNTGLGRILAVFSTCDPIGLLLALPMVAGTVLLRGLRWRFLMRIVGIDYSLRRSMEVYTIGFFAASVTPGKMGEVVRAWYVHEDTGRTFGATIVTVFMDRLWDLVFVIGLGIVSVLLFTRYFIAIPSVGIVIAASAVVAAAVCLALSRSLMRLVLEPLFAILVPERHKQLFSLNFNAFYDSLSRYGREREALVKAFFYTAATWALIFLLAYQVARALHVNPDFGYMMLIMPIVALVELVPISVSGLGTRDATVIYFFSVVGIPGAEAVGFSIGYVLIGTYLIALVGFIHWLRRPMRIGSVFHDDASGLAE